MSKMREAFKKYWTHTYESPVIRQAFEAGYQAAIAAVKEGGLVLDVLNFNGPLYKLPED